jgi:hypothetical protein
MEIYKDDVFDLMVSSRVSSILCYLHFAFAKAIPSQEAKLPVREDGRGKVFVANLTETIIETTDEFDTHFM